MSSYIRQTNFLGGELDRLLWGRTDSPLYAEGLRTLRNFFVSKSGAAVSRPGTQYIGQTKTQAGAPNIRLVPFVVSDTVSYLLEVGVDAGILYIRPYRSGVRVQATYLSYDALTVGFDTGDDTDLFGTTSLTHARIIADAATSPTGVLQLEIVSGPGFVDNEAITNLSGAGAATANGASGLSGYEILNGATTADLTQLKWAQTGDVMIFTNPGFPALELRRLAVDEWTLTQVQFATANPWFDTASGGYPVLSDSVAVPLPTADATHPAREWDFYVSLTVRDVTTGARFETQAWHITEKWDGNIANPPTTLTAGLKFAIYPDKPVTIETSSHLETAAGALLNIENTDYTVEAYNYYRGRGALVGFTGSTTTFGTFTDAGLEPDYASPPLLGAFPFQETAYTGVSPPDQYPFAVSFFQDRLAFMTTALRASSLWLSETGNYKNFDLPSIIHFQGESLLFDLAARRYEQGVHLFSDSKLLCFTGASVWSVAGAQGGPVDFDSIDARIEDHVGSSHVPPLSVDGTVLYHRIKGYGARALRFNGQVYEPQDVTAQSQHLFIGQTIISGDTYDKTVIDWAYAEDPWGLVWACREDGVLLSLTHHGDNFAWAHHDSDDARFFRVCAIPEGNEDAVYFIVQRTLNGALVNTIERMTSRFRYGNNDDDGCVDCGLKYTGAPALEIGLAALAPDGSSLSHLIGEDVYVIGTDNAPVGPLTVWTDATHLTGYITLPALPTANNVGGDEVTLYIGKAFTADLETLDVGGDGKLRHKLVTRVGFEVDQTVGIEGGQDFDHLVSTRPNTVASGYNAPDPQTTLLIVQPRSRWDLGARAVLRQSLPLPVTVVGVVREVESGG